MVSLLLLTFQQLVCQHNLVVFSTLAEDYGCALHDLVEIPKEEAQQFCGLSQLLKELCANFLYGRHYLLDYDKIKEVSSPEGVAFLFFPKLQLQFIFLGVMAHLVQSALQVQ